MALWGPAMFNQVNDLFWLPSRALWRKLLVRGGAILLALVVVELSIGGPVASFAWVIETLGPGGLAGVVCIGAVGGIVVWNML